MTARPCLERAPERPHARPAPQPDKAFRELVQVLAPKRAALLAHPLYGAVHDQKSLQTFMGFHVFAVWDFMSLIKRLQHDVCGTSVPWRPPADPISARFVNEVVLGEESDVGPDGRPISHFCAYLKAMAEVTADLRPIQNLLLRLGRGESPEQALCRTGAPTGAPAFSTQTLHLCRSGTTLEVAAAFLFGREDVIPGMFSRLLEGARDDWGAPQLTTRFRWYLERHIELDGEEHGPMAARLLTRLCGTDPAKWHAARRAAEEAIDQRMRLWDCISAQLQPASPSE